MIHLKQSALGELREDLGGFSTLSWERILGVMHGIKLTEESKQELVLLVLEYIERTMIGGHFRNLEGIGPVLDYLGVGDINLNQGWFRLLGEFDSRYDQFFLTSMHPGLINGKLHNGKPFEKIPYVRELLRKRGAPPEHLTDAYIESLWKMRETLIRCKRMNPRPDFEKHSYRDILKLLR